MAARRRAKAKAAPDPRHWACRKPGHSWLHCLVPWTSGPTPRSLLYGLGGPKAEA